MTPPDAQAGTAPTVATSANMDSHRALFVIGHLLPMGRFKQDANCGYADFPRKADHQSLACPPRKTAAELQGPRTSDLGRKSRSSASVPGRVMPRTSSVVSTAARPRND